MDVQPDESGSGLSRVLHPAIRRFGIRIVESVVVQVARMERLSRGMRRGDGRQGQQQPDKRKQPIQNADRLLLTM